VRPPVEKAILGSMMIDVYVCLCVHVLCAVARVRCCRCCRWATPSRPAPPSDSTSRYVQHLTISCMRYIRYIYIYIYIYILFLQSIQFYPSDAPALSSPRSVLKPSPFMFPFVPCSFLASSCPQPLLLLYTFRKKKLRKEGVLSVLCAGGASCGRDDEVLGRGRAEAVQGRVGAVYKGL
jgi:hypothetical protein